MLLLDRQMHAAFLAERGNDKARLILSRATRRAHHFDLILRWWWKNAGLRCEKPAEHSWLGRLGFEGTAERRACGLRIGLFTHLGLAHEGGTFFDGERASSDVTDEDGIALQFAALGDRDVAFDLAEDNHTAGFHLAFDESIFTHGQAAVGDDFAFDFAVDDEVVREFDRAFDLDVVGENVFAGCHDGCGVNALGLCSGSGSGGEDG